MVFEPHHYSILKLENLFFNKTFVDPNIQGELNKDQTFFLPYFLKKSFVYVITETVGDYPNVFFTEKTWKAMLVQMPFMLIGAKGSLRQLRQFGFKTFENWWDESYDSLPTVAGRIELVVDQLEKLSKLDIPTLTSMREEMEDTLVHNFNQIKIFRQQDLDNIRDSI